MKKDQLKNGVENLLDKEGKEKKTVVLCIYPDGYTHAIVNTRDRKVLKISDRLKNAIKAMAKEGYKIELQSVEQSELPFTENEKTA